MSKEEVIEWYTGELKTFHNKKHKMNIIKAIKKSVVIKFEKFTGIDYNGDARIQTENGIYKVFNQLHNSWIGLKIGDYINIENPEDNYPVDAEYFKNHYEIVEEKSV